MKKSENLKIFAYKTEDRNGSSPIEFDFIISPESFVSKYLNQFSKKRGINTSGRTAQYALSSSEEISLELMLDNTLVSSFNLLKSIKPDKKSIKDEVDRYLNSCFYMDGDIHEPKFLKLSWGKFQIDCKLKSVEVTYSIFDDEGEPKRANLQNVFVADMAASKRIRLENKKSPDISHSRTVLQGQTLTGLTKAVYGDAKHYLTVAKANNLDHFRCLKPGTTLYFPPLIK